MHVKTTLAPIALALALASCASDPAPVVPTPSPRPAHLPTPAMGSTAEPFVDAGPPAKMTTAEGARITLPAFFEAINQHDAKRFAGFFAEDATLTAAGQAARKGRQEIGAWAQGRFDAISSYKEAPTRVLVKGDVVAIEWSMNGTHSGDFLGVAATEKPVGLSGATILFFDADSGLVKDAHVYADDATILAQIGASKAKARRVPLLSSSPEWKIASGAPAEEKSEGAWRQVLDAISRKNEADFLAVNADDVAYDDLTQPFGMRGQSEARKWLKELATVMPDAKVTPSGVWGIEDVVVAEVVLEGTHKPSGKHVTLHAADVVQMKDGKVTHAFAYGDARELALQIAPAKAVAKEAKQEKTKQK